MSTVTPAALRLLPVTPDSQPFVPFSPFQGTIEQYDYIEEEWLASGTADGEPFTTMLIVRRPRDPKRFSGTVVLEPLHFFPITPIFMYCSEYLMRSGHGWVSVGALKTSVDAFVVPSNPTRYADVALPNAAVAGDEQFNFGIIPPDAVDGEAWWAAMDRNHSAANFVLAQTAAAVGASHGPFDGYGVQHVVYGGHSGTGHAGTNYLRQAHDTMRLADGSPVFHGFFPVGWPTSPLGPCNEPIVQVITEGDVNDRNVNPYRVGYDGMAYRRPDSDVEGDRFRLYELAGVAHTSTQHPPVNDLDFLKNVLAVDSIPDEANMSGAPFDELFNVCLDHLIRWVADGVVPPRAERLTLSPAGDFAFDEHSNALGGVRSAHLDVPRATYIATTREPDGSRRFGSMGFERRFDADTMRRLYGDAAIYRQRFAARLDELVAEGWWLPADTAYQLTLLPETF